jgi:hypothetical protein
MKSIEQVRCVLGRRLEQSWQLWVTACTDEGDRDAEGPAGSVTWPMTVALGEPSQAELAASFGPANRWALAWRDAAAESGLSLRWKDRVVAGSRQSLPTHLIAAGPSDVARFVASGWPSRLARATARCERLRDEFPGTASPALLRATDQTNETDFDLLLRTAAWLRENDTAGLTPRQVPVPGTHAKWLEANHAVLLALAGRADFGLINRPTRIGFTYLDPEHRRMGGRQHDSYTLGDTAQPAYLPQLAVISENKDTAVLLGPVPGGVSIEGNGMAAARQLPAVPWLASVPQLLYWGDLDAAGFEILNALRAAGLAVTSILMDQDTFDRYERYGSDTDKLGRPLTPSAPKPLAHLTADEYALYAQLVSPGWTRPRRIEQERIPLHHAEQLLRPLAVEPLAGFASA